MPRDVKLVLCDLNEDVVDAWKQQFETHPEVEIRRGDILDGGADALVVPGNAFGFLDRGFELAVCERFGFSVQDALREIARARFHGELLVGQACFTPLEAPFRELLYAPIYRAPQNIGSTVHAFLAARGVFLALEEPGSPEVGSVAFPGLGTGTAGLHPLISARQLRYAYEIFRGERGLGDKNLTRLARRQKKLASLPKSALEESESE